MVNGLPIKQEVVQDRGIWVVKYSFYGSQTYRVVTQKTPEEISGELYDFAMRMPDILTIGLSPVPFHLGSYGDEIDLEHRESNFYGLRGGLLDRLNPGQSPAERFYGHPPEAHVIFAGKASNSAFSLGFKKRIEHFPDSLSIIETQENEMFIGYFFGKEEEPRDPTQEEIALLNRLSKHAPKEGG